MSGKRIGLLSSWVSRRNGGVFEAVVRQADILRELGAQPLIFGLRDGFADEDRYRLGDDEVHLARVVGPPAIGYAPTLVPRLIEARLDALHCHGIWQHHVAAAGRWARTRGRPLIVSPHGMLDPWVTRRNRWKKALARAAWERRSWNRATLFHALTADEGADIAREVPGVRIAVVPNPAPPPSHGAGDGLPPPAVLYLGRIHAKKNLAALIEGWRLARPRLGDDARLVIAGWGDDDGIAALEGWVGSADDGVRFVGTAFGSQKAALLAAARFVVLPSLSEGLPMVVLEGWAAGVPSIMTSACHLPKGFAQGAALECGTDPPSIAAALIAGLGLPPQQWRAMSAAARSLADGTFGGERIARRWEAIYREVLP